MRQRVMIAIGLACNPKLIIADEPTTALDVTIQAQILELMKDLSRKLDIALIIITHNLGVVARYADRVIVMYAARMVEQGTADAVFHRPRHPYTMGLLRSVPRLDRPRGARLETIEGLPPNLATAPPGCRFAPRCPFRIPICASAAAARPNRYRRIFGVHPSRRNRRRQDRLGGVAGPARGRDDAAQRAALSVRGLTKHFVIRARLRRRGGVVRAVEDVSFAIPPAKRSGSSANRAAARPRSAA